MRIYSLRVFVASLSFVSCLVAANVHARTSDVMPPPQKAPRVAVVAQAINDATPKAPTEYEGRARAIDGERLMVGEKEIRLFGILTPALGSNYGPQAKDKLEQLVQGKDVLCKVTGRDAEARPVAFCGTVNTPDISYEMLRQGWAMLDRKSLKNNSLETVYGRVEQEAQTQNKGLFAPMPMTVAIPVTNPSRSIVLPDASAPVALETGASKKIETAPPAAPVAAEEKKPDVAPEQKANEPKMGDPAPDALVVASLKQNAPRERNGRSFVERYQQILSSIFLVLAAVGFGAVFLVRDRLRLRDRRRILAAALHGELSALRQICRTRARELARQRRIVDVDNQPRPSQLWPRLRITLFQAQAANLGLLGSDLSRQIARIYGQCADYAVMAQGTAAQARLPSAQAVSESLASLADQMENALEALATVENTGEVYVTEQVADDDYVPEEAAEAPAVAASTPLNEAEKRMEKAMEVMAGLFRNRREKTAVVVSESTETEAESKAATKTDDAAQKKDAQQAA